LLRDHGMGRRKYWHPVVGYSYGLGNLQAAIGLAQVERFDELLQRKDDIAARYAVALRGIPSIAAPAPRPGVRAVCWLVSILVDRRRFGMGRDALMRALAARGIETRPFFYPLHRMPPYRSAGRFPVAERLAAAGMNLPSGPAIAQEEIDRVVGAIREIREQRA
jgi:perosamine synthetase